MFRCRECETVLHEGRNWHASYAARSYRHCMACARAYSRRRYGRLKPNVKRRVPTPPAGAALRMTAARKRARMAQARRARRSSAAPGD